MKTLLLIVVAFFAFNSLNSHAEEIVVGVKTAEPFAYQTTHGQWKGLSIDLLDLLAEQNNFTYRLVDLKDVGTLVYKTSKNKVDMSIAAISLTPEREKYIDFSHSYFSTSLGILANSKPSPTDNFWWMIRKVVVILLALMAGMYAIGFLISRVDKGGDINGVHEGAWWALVTFSTTGYGDEVPITPAGKIVASCWIIASLFLISIFTGYISSAMTVKKLTESTTQLADLYTKEVNVIEGTTAQLKLAELGIEYDAVPTLAEAMENFKSGKTDVVVYDKAMLDYASKDIDNTDVWPIDNSDEYYAIALPPKSNLIEKINVGILKIKDTSKWKVIKAQYFGAE